ncbi:MAG: ATP-binding cassette domain-containing protein [Actinobacteria bacterium]|nr:ATP-binding cassette domain-containing protein [Actinomycetota bacterium]
MLELQGISKSFAGVQAVSDLSLRVPEGVIFGFLGPNGAGKTTTMRMVLDILRPDSGRIAWRGAPITDRVRRRFGYLPEERGLYPKMRVGDQLLFFARLHGMERAAALRVIDRELARFGIADRKDSRLEELSRGNQQKVQVLAALLHEPDLALLDEPFTGLDPINSELLKEALIALRDAGKTIVFCSHRLEQVEELCEDVAIIARGCLRLVGNLARLRRQATRRVVHLRVADGSPVPTEGLPLRPLEPGRDYLRFALDEGAEPRHVLATLVQRVPVELFALERPSLQEIFLEATADGGERSE